MRDTGVRAVSTYSLLRSCSRRSATVRRDPSSGRCRGTGEATSQEPRLRTDRWPAGRLNGSLVYLMRPGEDGGVTRNLWAARRRIASGLRDAAALQLPGLLFVSHARGAVRARLFDAVLERPARRVELDAGEMQDGPLAGLVRHGHDFDGADGGRALQALGQVLAGDEDRLRARRVDAQRLQQARVADHGLQGILERLHVDWSARRGLLRRGAGVVRAARCGVFVDCVGLGTVVAS